MELSLIAKGTLQEPEKLQNKLENKQSHRVTHIILYLQSQGEQEVAWLFPTVGNNTHVVIIFI